jgi:hypothetical protein
MLMPRKEWKIEVDIYSHMTSLEVQLSKLDLEPHHSNLD